LVKAPETRRPGRSGMAALHKTRATSS
jgi:hypothetical protein